MIDIVVVAKSMNKEMLRLQSGKKGKTLNHGDKAECKEITCCKADACYQKHNCA